MKLYYLNIYGRGEPIRMMLWKAGVQYEDIRINPGPDWQKFKKSGILPNEQVPMLELQDGTKMTQHHAIMHYLAMQLGFNASNHLDLYTGEHIYSRFLEDFSMKYLFRARSMSDDDPKKKEFVAEIFKTHYPAFL